MQILEAVADARWPTASYHGPITVANDQRLYPQAQSQPENYTTDSPRVLASRIRSGLWMNRSWGLGSVTGLDG